MSQFPSFRPGLEALEPREVPTTLLTEGFDGPRAGFPAGFSAWGVGSFRTTTDAAADGTGSLASSGPVHADARIFTRTSYPADSPVSLKVRSDAVAPVEVIARGTDLARPTARYLALTVSANARELTLFEVDGATRRALATLTLAQPLPGTWLTVTLVPVGGEVFAEVQRADTGHYLNRAGVFQPAPAAALSAATAVTDDGRVGIGRGPGGAGRVFADTLTVAEPNAVEHFDTTAVGSLPRAWRSFTDGTGFATAQGQSRSIPNGFASNGGSRSSARAWPDRVQAIDHSASVNVFANGLIPAGVFLRGSNPGSASANYYSVAVVRGVEVELSRVEAGVVTRLATVKSRSYLSGVWLNVTAVAQGDQLRAVVQRLDSGEYLDAEGNWHRRQRPAAVVRDAVPLAGTTAGVAREARYAGAVTLDDFHARPVAPEAAVELAVTLSQPATGVSGELLVTATATPPGRVAEVEFYLNGRLRSTVTTSPATWTLATGSLTPGAHTLEVRAVTATGDVTTWAQPITVLPAPGATGGEVPRHHSHVRVAALAYAATPFGAFEEARLADSVDLVIPNPRFAEAIHAVAPRTPQLVYSNISNLYLELLSDWLGFAARTGADREAAFYHVAAATPFTGGSPSSQPVTWVWSVRNDGTDVTAEARGGRVQGIRVGSNLDIAHVDRFDELQFTIDRAAGAGWAGTFEYASAVDATGRATAWKPLALTADTTLGLTRAGAIRFRPPSDWAAGATYAIRLRTTSGSAIDAPVVRTIFGRDYVQANGRTQGVIPAYDAEADRDGDGYLDDNEYALRRSGFDARFVHESRLFYPFYGQMRFAVNPSSPAVRTWAGVVHEQLLARHPRAGGIFLDNSNGRLPVAGIATVEATAGYREDYAALVAAIRRAGGGKFLLVNTAGGREDANPVAAVASGSLEEFALRPTDANWSQVRDLIDLIDGRLEAGGDDFIAVIDSHPGSFPVGSDRVRASTLAYYYIVGDPDRTALMMSGGFTPSAPWRDAWIDSVSVDIGRPQGRATVWATGADPTNAGLTYQVFRREYAGAISVYKPRSYATGRPPGTTDDATATTHDLGGSYQVLNPDGTRGPVVRSITLRNGEGVVLLRV